MNPEKLKALQEQVRIGGKGSARRKKKVMHKTSSSDDKKLQNHLKKMGMNTIPGIEQVNMFQTDGNVLHFTNPRVSALVPANTFAVTGTPETKSIAELLPDVLSQLDPSKLSDLKKIFTASAAADGVRDLAIAEENDEDVPELTGDFESAAASND